MSEDFIKKIREKYERIGSMSCPAFSNARIYFNNDGFNHLVSKEGKPRKYSDLMRKLHLFEFVPNIISFNSTCTNYKKDARVFAKTKVVSTAEFWELSRRFGKRTVIVVIRRINNGPLHFFSVKDKK